MPIFDRVFELLPPIFGSLSTMVALYAMGRFLLRTLSQDLFGHHVAVALGFGANHLVFLLVSLFLNGPNAVLFMNLLHASAVAHLFLAGGGLPLQRLKGDPSLLVVLSVIFMPYLYRLATPPMNVDTLNFYMPNIEWVYHRGLAFNPHLTAYTTMPMAAEYLFAQSYGLGGRQAVLMTDAVFCILTIMLCHGMARLLMPRPWAFAFILSMMLLPQSYTYLFGSAKVDMVNVYLVLTGMSLLLKPLDSRRMLVSLAIGSIAFSVKYTSWPQLALPVVVAVGILFWRGRKRQAFMGLLIPLLFAGPVMLKNQIQVGNPLAPVVWSPSQRAYLAAHLENEWDQVVKPLGKPVVREKPVLASTWFLQASVGYLLYAAMLLLLPLAVYLRTELRRFVPLLLLLPLSLGPWHAIVGAGPEPPRFTLPFLTVILLSLIYMVSDFSGRLPKAASSTVAWSMAVLVALGNLLNSHGVHSDIVTRYRDARDSGVVGMYIADGKGHYAISRVMADSGWLERKVMYLAPLVLGTLSHEEVLKSHTDLEIHLNRRRFKGRAARYDFIYCTKPDIARFGLSDKTVLKDYGHYCLLKR
jgi:hypothetical protein